MKPDESRIAYDGKLIDVTVERWGEHEREIVEHPGAVAIVAVDAWDNVVLVRQLREPARKELLELPAGTLDAEEEPLASAQRELAEETGLTGGEWHHATSFWTTPGFCRERMHVFFAERVEEGEQRLEADEAIGSTASCAWWSEVTNDSFENRRTIGSTTQRIAPGISRLRAIASISM